MGPRDNDASWVQWSAKQADRWSDFWDRVRLALALKESRERSQYPEWDDQGEPVG